MSKRTPPAFQAPSLSRLERCYAYGRQSGNPDLWEREERVGFFLIPGLTPRVTKITALWAVGIFPPARITIPSIILYSGFLIKLCDHFGLCVIRFMGYNPVLNK